MFDVALEQGSGKWSDAEQNISNCKTPGVWVLTRSLLADCVNNTGHWLSTLFFIKDLNKR